MKHKLLSFVLVVALILIPFIGFIGLAVVFLPPLKYEAQHDSGTIQVWENGYITQPLSAHCTRSTNSAGKSLASCGAAGRFGVGMSVETPQHIKDML